MGEDERIQQDLLALKEEHRNLDAVLLELMSQGGADQLRIQRLKRRKLQLKDKISQLESYLHDDIIA